jgi:hypothetical protein
VGKMLVKIGLRTRTIFLWYAAKHKPVFYNKTPKQVVMIPLQPAILISARMPLIMVETVAASVKWIAPKPAQSEIHQVLKVSVCSME